MKIKDLDLNLLVVFEAIYDARNISRAADLLDLTQPAISNALKRLRTQTGDQLFVRSAKGVTPTTRADEMIGPIRNALALITQSSIDKQFDPQTQVKRFQLLLADPLEALFLPTILNAMSGTELSVELNPLQAGNIEDALISGKVDMAAFLLPPDVPGVCVQELFPLDLVVIAREGHPRISGSVSPEQLLVEDHVVFNLMRDRLPNTEKFVLSRREGFRKICVMHTLTTAIRSVAVTDCVAHVPRAYAEYAAPIFGLQVLTPPRQINDQQFYLVWHERNTEDPAHIWLRDLITRQAEAIRDRMRRQGLAVAQTYPGAPQEKNTNNGEPLR